MTVTYEGPGGVYSDVAIAGDTLYLSGLISQDPETGAVVNGTIEEETELALRNLELMLAKHGSSMEKLIRVEIFLTDFYGERDRMNAVYVKHFAPGRLPARLCVGTNGLACGCKIEIMATACR